MSEKYPSLFLDISVGRLTFSDRKEIDMDSRTYYYGRVSSREQNLARQIQAFLAIGAQERETIRKRQEEGIVAAKASGKRFGRPAIGFPEGWEEVYGCWKRGEITARGAMERLGLKRSSFYKLAKQMEG